MISAGDLTAIKAKYCGDFGDQRSLCEKVIDTLRGPKACSKHNHNNYGKDLCVSKELKKGGASRYRFPMSGLGHANAAGHLLRALRQSGGGSTVFFNAKPAAKASGEILENPILRDLGFVLTHRDEWQPVQSSVAIETSEGRYRETIQWYYYLKIKGDRHTLYWRQSKTKRRPGRGTPHVTFQLQDGQFPANLKFVIKGKWKDGMPKVKVKLKLD